MQQLVLISQRIHGRGHGKFSPRGGSILGDLLRTAIAYPAVYTAYGRIVMEDGNRAREFPPLEHSKKSWRDTAVNIVGAQRMPCKTMDKVGKSPILKINDR